MFGSQYYAVISLKEKAFRNPETVRAENFTSGRFLALDVKEKENEYHVIFVDDHKNLQVLSTEKVAFEGFVSAEEAAKYLPAIKLADINAITPQTPQVDPLVVSDIILDENPSFISTSLKNKGGRPKKEA